MSLCDKRKRPLAVFVDSGVDFFTTLYLLWLVTLCWLISEVLTHFSVVHGALIA